MGVKSTDRGPKGFGPNKILDQHMVTFYDSNRAGKGTNPPVPYEVVSSLRFNYNDTNYLYRDFTTSSNAQKWTFSAWVKRSTPSDGSNPQFIFGADNNSTVSNSFIGFAPDDTIRFQVGGSTTYTYRYDTISIFRDYSAWMHIVGVLDTTAVAPADRVKLWVNNVLQSFSVTSPSIGVTLNYTGGQINGIFRHAIATHYDTTGSSTNFPFGGYIADVHFIDGLALNPTDFAETNSTTGQWVPKAYTGSYGTNGFRLQLPRNISTVGQDSSGLGNNWTAQNISFTAGPGYDGMVDSPTRKGTVDNGLGGELLGNYATLNPINPITTATISNGNLDYSNTTSVAAVSTFAVGTGKWYWEVQTTAGTTETRVGLHDGVNATTLFQLPANNTVYGIRFDADAGTLDRTSDGSTWTSIASGLTSGLYTAYFANVGTTAKTVSVNFGQRAYTYTAPSGYKTLCSFNIPDPPENVKASMDVVTYTGSGAAGFKPTLSKPFAFSPNLVWIKDRDNTYSHRLYDTLRGVQNSLETNVTQAQNTSDNGVTSFDSTGFTLGTNLVSNTLGDQYVAWCWNENPTSGFDIVTYTGNGANRQISHALGAVPEFMIFKSYSSGGFDWIVWHRSMPITEHLRLNTSQNTVTASSMFNSTLPTSSVFSLGTNTNVNSNGISYVSYLWNSVEGYSYFGRYIGNNSANGPYINCGFKPRFVMIKSYDGTSESWVIFDTERDTSNARTLSLTPDTNNIEDSGNIIDIVSNGFKIRDTGSPLNTAGITYIFAAFAEVPFKYSRAV